VLAGHSPIRPSHLGVSRCTLPHADGLELTVQGLDAIEGLCCGDDGALGW
jgi:tRNA (Thr-GGU) A37 N-methylase